ncbi:MAG: hypothetical protein ACUVWJ_02100 [Spirochaetota bacterium]
MLNREIKKRNENSLAEAFRFWGVQKGRGKNTLYEKITERMWFINHITHLSIEERKVILFLLRREDAVLRGELRECFEKSIANIDSVIDILASRLFVYLRKDRAFLTDRTDKVYLFSEVRRLLDSFEMLSLHELEKQLSELITDRIELSENANPLFRELVMVGGTLPLEVDEIGAGYSHGPVSYRKEMVRLYKDGLVDVVFVHEDDCFFPVWLLKRGGLNLFEIDQDHACFKQSLYLNTLIRLMDCFFFKMQEGFLSARMVSECMKRVVKDFGLIKLYQQDLEKLGILIHEGDKFRFMDRLLFENYEHRVKLLEKLLGEDERAIIKIVKDSRCCTRLYLVSSMMRKVVMAGFLATRQGKVILKDEMMRFLDMVEKLLFRGFLVEDFNSKMVAYNSFQITEPPPNSLVVNPDLEIIVFGGKYPFHSFYVLAGFSRLLSMNELIRFKVDRSTLWQGMAYIGDVDVLIKLLEKASKYPLGDAVVSLLRGWAAGFVRLEIQRRWLVKVESNDAKLKLFQNRWIRSNVVEAGKLNLILREGVDINRFMKEIRKESVYVEITGNDDKPQIL